jgi:hypothetical protein
LDPDHLDRRETPNDIVSHPVPVGDLRLVIATDDLADARAALV